MRRLAGMVSTPAVEPLRVAELTCEPPACSGRTVQLRYLARAADGAAHEFTEVVEFPASLDQIPAAARDQVLRLLSFAACLSYFKAFAPAEIAVPEGLTAGERRFLSELTRNGLGEFAYVNQLPEVLETRVVAPDLGEVTAGSAPAEPARVLVAVGGGKDSIVSIEALKDAGFEVGLFSVNSYAPIEDTARVAGLPLQSVRRRLDPGLFRLNEAGAPNGHVPVTAVNSLLAVLTAMALGYDTVVFSNEASSSYGNVVWQGRTINHQWSKSIEFERLLRESLPAQAPQYVSLLRPITELRIACRFARHTEYHQVFTSCNRAFRLREDERTTWCADCPKCRFVFLCLAPYLRRDALLRIFDGRDMFADPTQLEGFLELLGSDGLLKPFECVGEPDECRVALALLGDHQDWQDHPFLARPELAGLAAGPDQSEAVFAFRGSEHFLPARLEAVAREI